MRHALATDARAAEVAMVKGSEDIANGSPLRRRRIKSFGNDENFRGIRSTSVRFEHANRGEASLQLLDDARCRPPVPQFEQKRAFGLFM